MISNNQPLCVDLDGTLVATDTLWESVLLLLKHHFWLCFWLPFWVMRGKAHLKDKIAQHVTLNVALLPYRENVLAFLQNEQTKGRKLVLATAAHEKIAQAVAQHLKLFDEVIASDAHINMKGATKRDALQQRFGVYDYMGDSQADLPLFQAAAQAFLVAPSTTLLKKTPCPPERVFLAPKTTWWVGLKALRPHQWVKNSLVFLPLLLSHQFLDFNKLGDAFLAALVFSLAASSGYILNDLLDLAADRIHPSKKYRPFACGQIPIPYGLFMFVALIGLSFSISAWWLPAGFTGMVGLYFLITMTYSFYFKQKVVLDVIVLAGLYTHRIFAGGIAVTVPISSWLLGFSMFIFISLALLKRYTELLQLMDNQKLIKSRGYEIADIEMIASIGPTSGYLAVLVFSLYINSEAVSKLYDSPFILWLISPLLLYWITRVWFLAHRRQMLDDPVQFALIDRTSWFIIICIGLLILLAKLLPS